MCIIIYMCHFSGTNENDDGVTVTIFSNNSETHTFDLVTFDLTGENEMIGSKNVDKAVNRLKTATNEGPIILGLGGSICTPLTHLSVSVLILHCS